jgi:hypothetical protein
MLTITRPPSYQAESWPAGAYPIAPFGYAGIQFDFSLIERLIRPIDEDYVEILGVHLPVTNTQFELEPGDPNHPIYFIVLGLFFNYVFSIWEDRVEIEVWTKGIKGLDDGPERHLSCMFPVTEAQFRQALESVVADNGAKLMG